MNNNDLTILSKAIGLESRAVMDYASAIIKADDEKVFSQLVFNVQDEFKMISDLRKLLTFS